MYAVNTAGESILFSVLTVLQHSLGGVSLLRDSDASLKKNLMNQVFAELNLAGFALPESISAFPIPNI